MDAIPVLVRRKTVLSWLGDNSTIRPGSQNVGNNNIPSAAASALLDCCSVFLWLILRKLWCSAGNASVCFFLSKFGHQNNNIAALSAHFAEDIPVLYLQ